MRGIHDLLQRFSGMTPPEIVIRREGAPLIAEILGVSIPEHSLIYQQRTLFVQGNSSLKHLVTIKKEILLEALRTHIPTVVVHDIR